MTLCAEPSRATRTKNESPTVVKPTITAADLAFHNKPDDVWIAIDGKVFDVTKWASLHPGGEHLLHSTAGQDVTSVFNVFHTDHGSGGRGLRVLSHLPHVANLERAPRSKLAQAFIDLQERVDKEGLYNTSVAYYLVLAAWLVALLAGAIWLTLRAEDAAGTAAAAAVLAAFLQQCAFLGHDTGHNGITHDRTCDMVIGLIAGPLLTGISTAWWKRNHNAHHVVTNSVTHDPDIQHMPIFAITDELWRRHGGTFSFYYKRFFRFDSLAKFLISYQHILYYPVMAFARWNLYVQGWLLLLDFNTRVQWRGAEIVALMLYWTGLSMLTLTLPTVGLRFMFLLLSHMFAGILHVQITLSHFAMPTYSGSVFNEGELGEEFLRQQLATSMDVDSEWWNDWFYGGLQWQVAHHIFPRLPRHSLRRAREMLQALCREHGLEYKSVGWWEGNAEVIRTLWKAAMRARESKPISFKDSELWKALNAEG